MKHNSPPEDVRRLCGTFREPCDLQYLEIVRDEDARQAIERWPMFKRLLGRRRVGSDPAHRIGRVEEN